MRRMSLVGICMLALCAFGWVASASASAAEFGQCVSKKKGSYTNSGCTVPSAKPHKGTYEWRPGAPPYCFAQKHGAYTDPSCTVPSAKPRRGKYERGAGPGFTSTGAGAIFGEAPALGGSVTCTGYSSQGQITGPTTGTVQLTLTGCVGHTSEGSAPCTTPGENGGTILAPMLDENLLEPTPGTTYTQFVSTSGSGGYSEEFDCYYYLVQVAGSIGGENGPGFNNVMTKTNTLDFGPAYGEQDLLTYVNGVGPFATEFEVASTITSASEMEIRD